MLIDDARVRVIGDNPEHCHALMSNIDEFVAKGGVVVDVQSAVDYLFDREFPSIGSWVEIPRHIHDARPPDSVTWIEYSREKARFGALLFWAPLEAFRIADHELIEWTNTSRPSTVLCFYLLSFARPPGIASVCPGGWGVFLNENGCVEYAPSGDFVIASSDQALSANEKCRQYVHQHIPISLFALSMMNVKNISLRKHAPDAKLQAKRKKKGKHPLVAYHTIEIEAPGKRPSGPHGNGNDTFSGNSRPLHLVRGHIADYRSGKGLFGKHKGVFYVPSHMRGSSENGVVHKRYKTVSSVEDA